MPFEFPAAHPGHDQPILPRVGGISIGPPSGNPGSLGIGVRRHGAPSYALTAKHVAPRGNGIYQPGKQIDMGTDLIGTIEDHSKGLSLIRLNGHSISVGVVFEISGIVAGHMTQGDLDALTTDVELIKVGRTTGFTEGMFSEIRAGIVHIRPKPGEPSPISAKGDSGAAWITKKAPHRLVGIHNQSRHGFAGAYAVHEQFDEWGLSFA